MGDFLVRYGTYGFVPYTEEKKPQSLWLQLWNLHGRFHLAITSASWILWAMRLGKLSSLMAGRDGWTDCASAQGIAFGSCFSCHRGQKFSWIWV